MLASLFHSDAPSIKRLSYRSHISRRNTPPRNQIQTHERGFYALFDTIRPILVVYLLLAVWPADPVRLRAGHDTDHPVGRRKWAVNGGGERVDQLGPLGVVDPQHRRAVDAEGPLGLQPFLVRRAPVGDGVVLPVAAHTWCGVRCQYIITPTTATAAAGNSYGDVGCTAWAVASAAPSTRY